MLKVNFFHTCDYAIIEAATGKISIIGIFENINAELFPAMQAKMSMVIGFEGDPNTAYDLELATLDEKEDIIKIPFRIQTGENGKVNWIQNIIGYQIPRELTQKILVKHDNQTIHSSYLTLNKK